MTNSNSTSNLNHNWSTQLIQLLYFAGVRDICIAPGSRSAPLTIAAEFFVTNQPETQDPLLLHGHYDERGLGFFALGIAKAKTRPVVVITTSGTAVANLLPATIEANQTGVPLILVTADRPDELLDCGANQAIRQKHLFGEQVKNHCNLPTPSIDLTPDVLTSILEPLFANLRQGPIHINCPFRDPLYPDNQEDLRQTPWFENPYANDHFMQPAFDRSKAKRQLTSIPQLTSLVVVGAVSFEDANQILNWAEQQGHIVVADISSNLRFLKHKNLLAFPELLLATQQGQDWFNLVDQVIQFGGRLVSKRLNQWLGTLSNYYIVSAAEHYFDPHKKAIQIQCDANYACELLRLPSTPALPNPEVSFEQLAKVHFDDRFSEISVNRIISRSLAKNTSIFIGNSLSIRWMDLLSSRNSMMSQTYTNRGASGIDGLIATAAGITEAGKQVLLVLGDTSALHDLNSLALAAQCSTSITIVVINNQGGSIFNLLPAAQLPDINKRWFKCQHNWSFEQAALMFDIDYHRVTELKAFRNCLEASQNSNCANLIECRFEPDQATEDFKSFMNMVTKL